MEFLKDILFAVMVASIKDETNNLMSKISTLIIDKALYYVPAQSQDRYAEEWKAHLNECPSSPRKIVHSVGCFCYARRTDQLLVVSSRLLIASAFLFLFSPVCRKFGDYYLSKSKLYLALSRFAGQIGAKTLSQRLRRGGAAVARMSFLSFDMNYCCSKFRYIPQHCPVGSSVRDYQIYWKVHALVELWSTLNTMTRYSSIPVIRAIAGKAPTKASIKPLPEILRFVNQAKIFPPKQSRIKWHRRIR